MTARNVEDLYPLSPMQQGMLYHSLYAPETGVYFEQTSWKLQGDLDARAFERAWQQVLDANTALRTAFLWEDLDEPLQVVYRQVPLPLERLDWRGLGAAEQKARLTALLEADRTKGFDLAVAPLMRLALIQVESDVHHLVWSHHHLLLDGWSVPLVFQQVFALYEAYRQGIEPRLKPTRPYRDYIAWLKAQDLDQAQAFWRRTLAGFHAPTPLVVGPTRTVPAEDGEAEDYAWLQATVSADVGEALQDMTRRHRLTVNTVVQGAWSLLLSRYSGQSDVVFGATVAGRPVDLPGAETILGLFINTLPVRVKLPARTPVWRWLEDIQAHQIEYRQYEYSPLVDIQGWSEVPRDQPLFESLLVFENYPVEQAVGRQLAGLAIVEDYSFTRTNYPLTVAVTPGSDIRIEIAYDTRRFDGDAIRRMARHFETLLRSLATQPEQRLEDVSLLTPAERSQLLIEWNDTSAPYPDDVVIHHLVEAQAKKAPSAVAVEYGGTELTYGMLDQRANQLAHHLQKLGVGPETLVAISVERSPEMIVALLGVLKAGGAFLPMDPNYPEVRLASMLHDSDSRVLITQEHLLDGWGWTTGLAASDIRVVRMDSDWPIIANDSPETPVSSVTPDNLAYVIYTSGSTGRPKGVLLRHQGLCNLIEAQVRDWSLSSESRVLQFASFSFDAAVSEIFLALTTGATLVMADQETVSSPVLLQQLMQDEGITAATLPPTMLRYLAPDQLPSLETVVSAGEQLPLEVAARWAPVRAFFNAYGPTEVTLGPSWYRFDKANDAISFAPIGKPIANVQIYLVDEHLHPVPVGVPGELCVGGVGLAWGYLKRPGLTAERFIPDPFGRRPGARLYRTGDLACYLPDGNIVFLGRIDHQVKVRGYRIELGEIEAALRTHPAVEEVVVANRKDDHGVDYLAAYVVPADQTPLNSGDLRSHVQERLPDFMLPAAYVMMDALPLSPAGKIDRNSLPDPDSGRDTLGRSYVAPRTPVEEGLAAIWADVLDITRVGVHDNFFHLGGHSLLATQLVSRARQVFRVELTLRALFDYPTVAGLAAQIESMLRSASGLELPPIKPIGREETLALSYAQQRLWFLDQLDPGNLFYNIPLAVRLSGRLDTSALESSLNEIIRRHEALRTTFEQTDGRPVQVVAQQLRLNLPVKDLSHLPESEKEAQATQLVQREVQHPFDLDRGPLIRALLLKLDDNDHVAVVTMHHIVSDGWSMGVFLTEMAALYAAFSQDQPSPLLDLPVQYADYSHWQRDWLEADTGDGHSPLQQQMDYWRERLADSPPVLELPTDRPRPAMQTARGATVAFELPPDLAEAVRGLGRDEGSTLFMTLLAAFQVLLHRYSGQDDITVGTPIANRSRSEIEDLIGFFVNTLVMRADLSEDPTFLEFLEQVRETALGAYTHQDLPFELLVETLQPRRDLSHTPLFQVMFVLDTPAVDVRELPELTLSPIETHSGAATFDLTLSMSDTGDRLGGYVEYNTDLFDASTIERMIGHLQVLLSGIVEDPNRAVSALPVLTGVERQQMLAVWNETAVATPVDHCAHQLFEAHAAQRPSSAALTFEDRTLTYEQLNRRANQLGHHLRRLGVGPEVVVGIATERGPDMIVAILATLKAGGAYLPLDPAYPQARLSFMIEDSGIGVLLTHQHLLAQLPILGRADGEVETKEDSEVEGETRSLFSDLVPAFTSSAALTCVLLDSHRETIAQEPDDNLLLTAKPHNAAYVIYTSGSTGRPKGAVLPHRGLANLVEIQRQAFDIAEGSRILQFSPFSFDASVWETFMALGNGGTLCLAQQEVLSSGPDLLRLLRDQRVTTVTLPPSVLAVLEPADLPDLSVVIAAGEKCTPEIVARWAPGRRFFNAYGPTETTVCASMALCDEADSRDPTIGRPIGNSQLFVLDRHLQPVPIGVPGELVVGGVNVGRGYLGRPGLSAERFIPNPFAEILSGSDGGAMRSTSALDQDRIYRTGDLVRYRADGDVEFLGRIDHQVKVRGFRIELGEIEAVLRQHEEVADAVVAASGEAGDARLIAYVLVNTGATLQSGHLRSFLRRRLPDYMVPAFFVTMDAFPLSPSGKVDRSALPASDGLRPVETAYVAPRNETERRLADISAELLRLKRVGVHDNFFELGGHSLLATQFISRVRDVFETELPLRALFEHPTVAELAVELEQAQAASLSPEAPPIVPISRDRHRMRRADLAADASSSQARTPPQVDTPDR